MQASNHLHPNSSCAYQLFGRWYRFFFELQELQSTAPSQNRPYGVLYFTTVQVPQTIILYVYTACAAIRVLRAKVKKSPNSQVPRRDPLYKRDLFFSTRTTRKRRCITYQAITSALRLYANYGCRLYGHRRGPPLWETESITINPNMDQE